jgi:cobalt-zinc-cadmium efflux system outer membrane protein
MLQFRNSVKQAELALASARIKVQSLIGRKTFSANFDVQDDLRVPLSAADLQLSALQESALSFRPDVRVLTLSQARSQYDLKLQLANGKVDFTYGAEYRRQQGVNGKGNSLGVFFSAPLPLYNRNQGEIARVQAEQTQLDRQMQATNAQVLAEVNTAYQEFVAAREMVQSIEAELLGPAQQARDTAFYVYSNGGSSLLEFLDAQRALNDTMQTYQQAQAEYRRAAVQINATVNQEVVQP